MATAQNCGCPSTLAAGPPGGPSLGPSCGAGLVTFMSLLDVVFRQQCFLDDPCRRVRPVQQLQEDANFDFVVVGAGSAGATLAARLSEDPSSSVLLVEAGGEEPAGVQVPPMLSHYWRSELDWAFVTEPEERVCRGMPERRCAWTRGKVLGGSSTINGMVYVRGQRHDYDSWAAAGNPGWSFDEVLPYFKKSEDNLQVNELGTEYHGVGGPLTITHFNHKPEVAEGVLRAGDELGIPRNPDLNGAQLTGISVAQTTSRDGHRLSTARAFLRPARNRTNLSVMLNTTVTKILIDPTNKAAYGVEYIHNGLKGLVKVNKEVIISGGAINSPQLLLLSGVGPENDLQNLGIPVVHNLPGVGKNLNNHVAYPVTFTMKKVNDTFDIDWLTLLNYMQHRQGPMSSTGLSQVTAKFNTKYADPSGDDPDLQMFFHSSVADCGKTGAIGELRNPGPSSFRKAYFVPVVLHPRSRGHITLNSSNPLDNPLIYANYLDDPRDTDTLVEGLKLAVKLGQTNVLKNEFGFELDETPEEGCEILPFATEEYWKCAVGHISGTEVNHQAGSCKMGPESDPEAVVDSELKVHGIKALRVVDASVIPGNVSGNTNAPVIMIAEKAADLIKTSWGIDADGSHEIGFTPSSSSIIQSRAISFSVPLSASDLESTKNVQQRLYWLYPFL